MSNIEQALNIIYQKAPDFKPDYALVLGSGLGSVVDTINDSIEISYRDLPGFPKATVKGHNGKLILGKLGTVSVAVMQGRAHYYEYGQSNIMLEPLTVLRHLGADKIILTNASGSLIKDVTPGSLMLINDHISLFAPNPLINYLGDDRFLSMDVPYDQQISTQLKHTAAALNIEIFTGTYCWCTGPSFESPAEIRALKIMGADAVGMSTVPENILARHLGFRVSAIANITNFASGMSNITLSHEQTLKMSQTGSHNLIKILLRYFEK